jgi:hypothetical protein
VLLEGLIVNVCFCLLLSFCILRLPVLELQLGQPVLELQLQLELHLVLSALELKLELGIASASLMTTCVWCVSRAVAVHLRPIPSSCASQGDWVYTHSVHWRISIVAHQADAVDTTYVAYNHESHPNRMLAEDFKDSAARIWDACKGEIHWKVRLWKSKSLESQLAQLRLVPLSPDEALILAEAINSLLGITPGASCNCGSPLPLIAPFVLWALFTILPPPHHRNLGHAPISSWLHLGRAKLSPRTNPPNWAA